MPSLDLFWATFALGCVFGVAARAGNFCLLRGLRQTLVHPEPSDWGEEQAPQGAPALQAFALALAVALVGTQVLAMLGEISLSQVLVVRPRFSPLGALTGGLMFGVGMALAHSCGARALVLLAGGNLRSLWVLLWLGLTAQATMTGVLAPVRQTLQGLLVIEPQGATLPGWLAALGVSESVATVAVTALIVLLLLVYALRRPALRHAPLQWVGALLVGATVVTGWWISAHIDVDPFEERPLTSLSFISPVAESWLYLQVAVGRELAAAVALVLGVLAGACVTALVSGTARWEGFGGPRRMASSALGGILMGLGGVVAMGCSIGQGLSGLSTLSLASMPAAFGIVLGALCVLQWGRRY